MQSVALRFWSTIPKKRRGYSGERNMLPCVNSITHRFSLHGPYLYLAKKYPACFIWLRHSLLYTMIFWWGLINSTLTTSLPEFELTKQFKISFIIKCKLECMKLNWRYILYEISMIKLSLADTSRNSFLNFCPYLIFEWIKFLWRLKEIVWLFHLVKEDM